MTYQEILKAIEILTVDEQDSLIELIRHQQNKEQWSGGNRAEAYVPSNDKQLVVSNSNRVTNQNTSHYIPERTPAETAEGLRKFENFIQRKRDLWDSMTEEEREVSNSQFAMLDEYLQESRS